MKLTGMFRAWCGVSRTSFSVGPQGQVLKRELGGGELSAVTQMLGPLPLFYYAGDHFQQFEELARRFTRQPLRQPAQHQLVVTGESVVDIAPGLIKAAADELVCYLHLLVIGYQGIAGVNQNP